MARDGLGPGEVQAVTFGDSAIQPLGGRSLIQSIARPQRKRPGAPCASEHQKTADFIGPVGITLSLSRRAGEWLGTKSQARRAGRQR